MKYLLTLLLWLPSALQAYSDNDRALLDEYCFMARGFALGLMDMRHQGYQKDVMLLAIPGIADGVIGYTDMLEGLIEWTFNEPSDITPEAFADKVHRACIDQSHKVP